MNTPLTELFLGSSQTARQFQKLPLLKNHKFEKPCKGFSKPCSFEILCCSIQREKTQLTNPSHT